MIIFRCRFLFVVATLSSCVPQQGHNENICNSPPGDIVVGTDASGQIEATNQGIHKWAYRLGRSSGPNSDIVKATIAACHDAIGLYVKKRIEEAEKNGSAVDESQIEADLENFNEKALFRVVQGRAGNCPDRPVGE